MSDTHVAPGGAEALAPAPVTPAEHTPSDLGRMLASLRHSKEPEPESAEPATEPDDEIPAPAENAAPVEEQPSGEQTEEAEPAQLPPIEPPRSWTKEAKERFDSLPRETQEYLAAREQERDRELRRSQNEAAEQRKAIEAERQAAEKARQQYEAALPTLMQTLQDTQQGAFADIKTVDDVSRLAQEDPFRYLQWQAHQTKVQAVAAEMQRAEQRKAQEYQSQWTNYVQKQNEIFAERVPEFADKEKAKQLTTAAIEVLHDKGFTDQELSALASGKHRLSIYDHRLQLLLLDGVKYRDAQKAKATVVAKPVPPVQKPGVAAPRGDGNSDAIKNISAKLERTGSRRDLADLITAHRRA